ncbi:MAG: tRNA (cytidine(34)-2'-O)-methyltransferase [Planctomycetes bacterium]|nr:tRNA (cytidine(34)-2'-O)-methyltransferase [Planctomycetota bacterium]
MLQIALWEPEIPPNTGNVARLCAAVGCPLHLVGRLGFRLDAKSLRRAGLDYWDAVELHRHDDLAAFAASLLNPNQPDGMPPKVYCLTAHADRPYTEIMFRSGDVLLFGSETRGLPPEILDRYHEQCYTIPMPARKVRSLNLANAVAIVLYEGLRQLHAW